VESKGVQRDGKIETIIISTFIIMIKIIIEYNNNIIISAFKCLG
jgi:hypothetical protein